MVGIELAIDPDDIAAELLCSIGKTLPIYPVVAADGCIYERSRVLDKEVYPLDKIKKVIKMLVNSRTIDEKYLGLWATELAPFPSPSPSFDEEIEVEQGEESGNQDETIDAKDEGKAKVDRGSEIKNNEAIVIKDVDEPDADVTGNESDDITFITTKAEAGDTDSMVELGEVYLGRSTKEEDEQGYYWFDKASEKGNELGTARKADCLLLGRGVTESYQDGYELIVEAASKDSAPALLRLGYYWSTGILGFKQNESKAEKKFGSLRKIAPHLGDSDIEQMKQDLASVIGHVDDSGNTPQANAKVLQSVAETKTTSENPNKMSKVSLSNNRYDEPESKADEMIIKKQCHSCGQLKPKTEWSKSQWSKPQRKGSCIACCMMKASAPSTEQITKQCFSCIASKPKTEYSTSQWKSPAGTGRCIDCCNPKASAATNSPTETPIPVEASNVSKTRSITRSEAGDEINISKTPKANADSEAKPATASDETDGKSNISQSAPTTSMLGATGHVKLCFECKQSKPQAGYTASQWKKRMGTGRCIACVSKTVQWQTGCVGNSLQVKPCGDCSVSKPHTDFSPNQWRKLNGTGRCKECVNKSLPYGG